MIHSAFLNPFQERYDAYSKLPDLTLTMTEEEILADFAAKQKQRGCCGSPDHVKQEVFISRVTGRAVLI